MKIHVYIQIFLLSLIVLYLGQGSFYPQGSIISQAALGFIIIISLVYLWKTLLSKNNKNLLYKFWTGFLALIILGYLFTGEINNSIHFGQLKVLLFGLLSFYPFYFFSRKEFFRRKVLIIFFLLIIIVAIFSFYYNCEYIHMKRLSSDENVVNNITYMFLCLMPFVFLLKNKKLTSVGCMLLLLYFIILGSKRGALITGFFGFLIYAWFLFKNIEGKYKFINYLLGFLLLAAIILFVYKQLGSNEYFLSRLESTGQQKEVRNINFGSLWQGWLNSDSYLNLLFGYGFAATLMISATGNLAHN